MNFVSGVVLGLREIWGNKFRSLLTLSGIVLGVAALVSMIGVLEGYFHNTEEWIVATGGLEKLAILADAPPKEQEHLRGRSPGRTLLDAEAIRLTCPLVEVVSPEVNMNGSTIERKDKIAHIRNVQGVTAGVLEINNYEMAEGRMFGDLDIERFTQVVVVGSFLARELYEPGEEVLGSTVSIKGVPFTVVGVLKHYEKGYQDNNWMEWKNKIAYVPISTMQRKLSGTDALTWLNVQVGDVADIDDAIDQMKNTLLHTHRGIQDFRVETKQEMVAQWQQAETTITYAMGGVAAISLLIGGIGITNVMLASINERIREIGIRKAVGARPWDVFNQFIAEAVALSLMGGILGLIASAGLIQILKVALASVEMVPTLSPKALLIGFSFSAGMGVLAGVYPAIRASRLDPIDALRYE